MSDAPYLMVDPVHDTAQPLSARAFTCLTAPRSRVMARYATVLFLSPDGEVKHLTDANPVPPGIRTMLRLRLGRHVPATYLFEKIDMSLDDFKVMLMDCATYMRPARRSGVSWWLSSAPLDEVKAIVSGARSFAGLYRAIPIAPRDVRDRLT